MGKLNAYTPEELQQRTFAKTSFYQTVVYRKLEDLIIDQRIKVTRACTLLGEHWTRVRQYLSYEQKTELLRLAKDSKNGRRI